MQGALLKNFSVLSLSNLLLPLASTALVVAISRLGGVEMLGEYSFILTFFFIGQTCTTGGMQILITRDVARDRGRAGTYFVTASAIGATLAVGISLVLVPGFVWSVPSPAVRTSIVLMAAALVPTVVASFGEATLLAFERAEDFVVIGLIEVGLRALTGTALVWYGHGLVAVAASFLAYRLLAAAALTAMIRRRAPESPLAFDRRGFTALLRQVPTVGFIPILNALYWRTDTLLLTWLKGTVDVGYYGACTRILDVTRTLPQAYGRAVYPVLAKVGSEAPEEFRAICRRSIVGVAAATVPVCLCLWLASAWIVAVLFGPAMAPAIVGMQIVVWVMVPYAISSTTSQILFATGNQLLDLTVNAIAVATSVALNLILIPRIGFVGAATTAVCVMSLHSVLQYAFVRSRVCDPGALGDLLRVGIVTAVAAVGAHAAARWGVAPALVVAMAVYGTGLWSVGVLKRAHLVRALATAERVWARASAVSRRAVAPDGVAEPGRGRKAS